MKTIPSACSTTLLAAMTALLCPAAALAQARFSRPFAPQEGRVAPIERPFRDEMCLNGSWQFQPVALPAGFQQGKTSAPDLAPPTDDGWEKTPLRIPSPWNVNAFPDQRGLGGDFRCYPSYPAAWNSVSMGWLKRTFFVPAAWRGRRLLLHFDAVAGHAQVLVNGTPIAEHSDIFLPFEADVTDTVHYGAENTLLVGVRKSSLFDVQGKYGRRPYQGGSMWGQHIAGIWQDVFLEAAPAVHVTDVFVQPQVDQNTLRAAVTIRNDTDHPATATLTSDAYPWISQAGKDMLSAPEPRWKLGAAAALTLSAAPVTVPAHAATTVTVSAPVDGRLKPWSPERPNLYGLVCRLRGNGRSTVRDTKYTRFGWRQLSFQGSKVLLNGKPLVMKGDSWHFMGIPEMTRRYAWAWFRTLKEAHLNAVRLHAEPYPPFFLDVADEQGILVLDEDAVWASDGGPKIDDPAFWNDTETHLRGLILRDRNHPSVFGWSVSNELMAVVRGVFHAPKEYQDQVIRYDGIWAGICRELDPTRAWISADGEDDGGGQLPTYVVHYGGTGALERAANTGKPWGVGEAGPAYYGSPEQIAQQASDPRAYLSFADRMEGVAAVSYQSLADQRKYGASYRSVFNLVWYGLKPLPLGMPDTTRPPALTDGITFPPFVEGQPGVQPERLGPYCTTLNPGYDPRLPLYQTWPLFDAIRDAQAEPPVAYKPAHAFAVDTGQAKKTPATGTIHRVPVLAGPGGTLAAALADAGVPVIGAASLTANASPPPLLFLDGTQPPGAEAKPILQRTLDAGGTVFVWGAQPATLDRLNALLPYPLELTDRTATSLVPESGGDLSLIAGLTPASLYFSELSPSTILPAGLGGPLIARAQPLLNACNTDWTRWNRQAETAKTIMVLRSEREVKPSGVALAALPVGRGRLLVCNIPAAAQTSQAAALNRTLLANLGIALGEGAAQRNVLSADGIVTRALACGWFGVASAEEGLAASLVAPNAGPSLSVGAIVKDRAWTPVMTDASGAFDLSSLKGIGAPQSAVLYLSLWLYSPKALDNLLLDPHLPTLDLSIGGGATGAQLWLNARPVPLRGDGGSADAVTAPALPLQQGWNHLLVKVVRAANDTGSTRPSLHLKSSQADYLAELRGAQEKP